MNGLHLQYARLPTVTTIVAPHGYDWKEITSYIMKTHNLEISGGLGPSVGLVRETDEQSGEQFLCLCKLKITVCGLCRCCVWDWWEATAARLMLTWCWQPWETLWNTATGAKSNMLLLTMSQVHASGFLSFQQHFVEQINNYYLQQYC